MPKKVRKFLTPIFAFFSVFFGGYVYVKFLHPHIFSFLKKLAPILGLDLYTLFALLTFSGFAVFYILIASSYERRG